MTKKIINNRMYNTETAKQLGYWSNGYTPSDFYFAEETLYQKKTGEYFLVGHGGPMSSYAESCAGQSCSVTILIWQDIYNKFLALYKKNRIL